MLVSSATSCALYDSPAILRPQTMHTRVRNTLRSLLFSVAEDLSTEDLHKLLFLTSDVIQSKHEKQRIRSTGSALDLFEVLLERDALNEDNIDVLIYLLSKIKRGDIMRKTITKWDRLKRQQNLPPQTPDPESPLPPSYDVQSSSNVVNSRSRKDGGLVQRRKRLGSRPSLRDLRHRAGTSGRTFTKYGPMSSIDWNDEEVQEILCEPFRQRVARPDASVLRHTLTKTKRLLTAAPYQNQCLKANLSGEG